VRETTGFEIVKNKPIVGQEIFTRESGIGADALFKMPLSMFALNPEFLNKKAKLVLGKKSGMMSINVKLQNIKLNLMKNKRKTVVGCQAERCREKGNLTEDEFLTLVKKYKQ